MTTCNGTKRDGDPCTLPAMAGFDWCFNHDPANVEYRKRSASRAATAKHSKVHGEIRDVRLLVREVLELLVTDDLNGSAAGATEHRPATASLLPVGGTGGAVRHHP